MYHFLLLADNMWINIEAVSSFGINFAADQCRALLKTDIPGIHFYTTDRSESVAGILSKLKNENLL